MTAFAVCSGLCPVCGECVSVYGFTNDGRLVLSCKDAVTVHQWEANSI